MILRQLITRQSTRGALSRSNQYICCKRCLATDADTVPQPQQIPPAVTLLPQALDSIKLPSFNRKPKTDDTAKIDAFYRKQHVKATTGSLGADVEPFYKPNELVENPPAMSELSLELLLASQAHMGHSTSLWNPANSRYIFGIREGIHIISLEVTAAHLRRAARVVSAVAERGGLILFVGTRKGQERSVIRAAELAGACHLFERWIPGSITNGQQILGRCRLKAVNELDEELESLEDQLFERTVLRPDLIICLNPLENYVLLHEAGQFGIPTIGIIDTDADPTWVTYPIPANDDSLRSVAVIAGHLGRAGEEGKSRRIQAAKSGIITYPPATGLVLPSEQVSVNDTRAPSAQRSVALPQIQRETGSLPADESELGEAEAVMSQTVETLNGNPDNNVLEEDFSVPDLSNSKRDAVKENDRLETTRSQV